MNRSLVIVAILLLSLQYTGCAPDTSGKAGYKLAVVIVIDITRPDYLQRYDNVFEAGFRRLLSEGILFTNMYHQHSFTETAVGHATISTGSYPARHGIVANDFMLDGTATYCVEDIDCSILGNENANGKSPKNLATTALGDWLKASDPESKVFSLSIKDRAAILMGGKNPDGVYWYDYDIGSFVSSSAYFDVLPGWVQEFNNERPFDTWFEKSWTRVRQDIDYQKYATADDYPGEDPEYGKTFPHNFRESSEDGNNRIYYRQLRYTPFSDEVLLNMAQRLITNEELGTDDHTDILFISFSASDYICHLYGPHSQELLDHYIRMDGYLDSLFNYLDEHVGRDNYVIALGSDHGVMDLPEYTDPKHGSEKRINVKEKIATMLSDINELTRELGIEGSVATWDSDISELVLDYELLPEEVITPEQFRSAVAEKLRNDPQLEDVFTVDELSSDVQRGRSRLFINNYFKGRSPDIMFDLKHGYLFSMYLGTTHGTANDYDRHVPFLIAGRGIPHKILDTPVSSVDIAPTVARLLGFEPPDDIDGNSLAGMLKEHTEGN